MAITWRTWDRALTGAASGVNGEDDSPLVLTILAALYDLSSSPWTPEDFAYDGGSNEKGKLDDGRFYAVEWQRKDERE